MEQLNSEQQQLDCIAADKAETIAQCSNLLGAAKAAAPQPQGESGGVAGAAGPNTTEAADEQQPLKQLLARAAEYSARPIVHSACTIDLRCCGSQATAPQPQRESVDAWGRGRHHRLACHRCGP